MNKSRGRKQKGNHEWHIMDGKVSGSSCLVERRPSSEAGVNLPGQDQGTLQRQASLTDSTQQHPHHDDELGWEPTRVHVTRNTNECGR